MAKSKSENYILSYYQGIKDGSQVVGKWIELLYEYIVKGLEEKRFFYDHKKAMKVIEYFEHHVFHVEGAKAPNPIELELWQKAFLSCVYGLVDDQGHRQFREVMLLIARKNGKSLLASGIGKYHFENGEEYGAKIYCLAPKLDQTDIVYNNLWQMVQLDPEYQAKKKAIDDARDNRERVDDSDLQRHRMTDLFYPVINSIVKKIAFSSKKSDGFNPSVAICDEIASWEGDKGLKQYAVMKSGQGAREEPLLLSCTTSGYVNDSIFDNLMKRATRLLLGDSKETRFLPFLYMIDDVEKWNDINELKKSNPNLGVSVSVDYMLEQIAIAEGSLSDKAEFLVKQCNIKQNSSLAWLDTKTVEKCCGEHLNIEDFKSSYCVCGIDLSRTTDLTSAICIVERDGEFYVFAKFWLPSAKIQEATQRDNVPYNIYVERGLLDPSGENFVDYHDCFNWLRSLVEEFEILPLQIGYDRYTAQYLVQDLNNYGFKTDDVFQGTNLWGVLQELQGVMQDGKLHIGDNDLLKMHFLNAGIKIETNSARGKLIKLSPTQHIDGLASLSDAWCVRQKWYNEIGEQLMNKE
jgi:phage terminase large subunit-like protein